MTLSLMTLSTTTHLYDIPHTNTEFNDIQHNDNQLKGTLDDDTYIGTIFESKPSTNLIKTRIEKTFLL